MELPKNRGKGGTLLLVAALALAIVLAKLLSGTRTESPTEIGAQHSDEHETPPSEIAALPGDVPPSGDRHQVATRYQLIDINTERTIPDTPVRLEVPGIPQGSVELMTDSDGNTVLPAACTSISPVDGFAFVEGSVRFDNATHSIFVSGQTQIRLSGVGTDELYLVEDRSLEGFRALFAQRSELGEWPLGEDGRTLVEPLELDASNTVVIGTRPGRFCLWAPRAVFDRPHALWNGSALPIADSENVEFIPPSIGGPRSVSFDFELIAGSSIELCWRPFVTGARIEVHFLGDECSRTVTLVENLSIGGTKSTYSQEVEQTRATGEHDSVCFSPVSEGNYEVAIASTRSGEVRVSSQAFKVDRDVVILYEPSDLGRYRIAVDLPDLPDDGPELHAVSFRNPNEHGAHVPVKVPLGKVKHISGVPGSLCRLWIRDGGKMRTIELDLARQTIVNSLGER